ncbi:programmed cell death protein 1 [Dasypus novemcinctus]|uniref:LOW QUALITY PROTEIN: programmed cell death protein 1 n=1 Tax=Dasypus novemcinctus TaxID=9361 RepID=UPI0003289DA1|nr:LOW QUALITY PROTEIN: programmed cell death protein 1 [Dasypus novemcinctus]XP_058157225.1 programmed cell death protein 1 [Dasypus novemcinctus]
MRPPRAPWPLAWAVLQLGWRPAWLLGSPERSRPWGPLAFSPAHLTVPEGANATFTCSLSRAPESLWLNWYRISLRNQTDKLAAFPKDRSAPAPHPRFHITRLPSGREFHLSILAAQRNDSGTYFCGAIHMPPETQITESPRAELTVTERAQEPPTAHPSPSPGGASGLRALVVGGSSSLGGVLLLLLAWVLATSCPRGSPGASGASGKVVTPEPPPAVSVPSVDYGELDFQQREQTPEPPAPRALDQTEYATIVFPHGPPGGPPTGRRGSADSLQVPRPPRPEEGHCSWPL